MSQHANSAAAAASCYSARFPPPPSTPPGETLRRPAGSADESSETRPLSDPAARSFRFGCCAKSQLTPLAFYFIVLIFRRLRLAPPDNYLLRSTSLRVISCEKMRTLVERQINLDLSREVGNILWIMQHLILKFSSTLMNHLTGRLWFMLN
jgi:hypothetical protein